MNLYFKQFGIWLGGASVLTIIIGQLLYLPVIPIFIMVAGMIMSIVTTHKANGGRIKFGPAMAASVVILVAKSVVSILLNILFWGADYISYMLEYEFMFLLAQVVYAAGFLLATGAWYMFEKAGKPGWAMLIPIYNIIVMCEIAEKPTWWVAMFFVPIANIVFLIMLMHGISLKFGKDDGFTVGLVLLGQIFMAVLGYGSAEYNSGSEKMQTANDLLDTQLG